MKKILVTTIILFTLTLALSSCGGKAKNNDKSTETGERDTPMVEYTDIHISEMHFGDNWNQLDKSIAPLTKEDYDAFNLGKLSFIPNYEDLQYEVGSIIDEPMRQLLTVKAIASGEISEYLLGYIDNNITDSLLVAYEDNVEYFSETSSILKGNTITVTTINFDYMGEEEVSDTIRTSYTISKELTFDEIL